MTTWGRLRASLVAVAVCAACAVSSVPAQPATAAPATPAAAATASSVPPYLTPRDATFTLNDKWHGTVPAATPGVQPANLQYYVRAPGDPGHAVWAPTCGAAQQTVTFARMVELLGPPSSGEFDWLSYYTPGSVWFLRPGATSPSGAVTSLELSVNGDDVFHQTGARSSSFTFPAGVFKDFKVGANTFVLKATRVALPPGSTACNRAGQKLMVALLGVFHFYFATDLRVGVPAEKLKVVKGNAKVYSQVVSEFVENLGPDRALDGGLNVFHGTAGSVRLVTTGSHPRFCARYPGSNTQYSCGFDQLDPGQRFSIIMDVTFTRPADDNLWDHEDETVDFGAYSSTPDTNSENNQSVVNWIFCSTTSTFPACNAANTSNPGGTAGPAPTTTAPTSPAPPSPAPPGSYGLASGLTHVSNAQGGALTINPSADNAVLNHTGKYGGAGKGGNWKVAYSWKLPPRLILGKPVPITIAAAVSDVNPKQPLGVSIDVLAPNLVEQLAVNYPPNGPSSKTIQYTLAPDESGAKDITVSIGFESSYVTYHYRSA